MGDENHYMGLSDRLERLHTEQKSLRDHATNNFHLHDARITKLEFLDQQKEERMKEGAKTFQSLRDQISMPWWKVIGLMLPGISSVVGLAYFMGSMPTSVEYRTMQDQVNRLQVNAAETTEALKGIRYSIEDGKATNKDISKKLDDLMAKKP